MQLHTQLLMAQFARPRLPAQLVALNVGIVIRGVRHPRTKVVPSVEAPVLRCSDSIDEYMYSCMVANLPYL